MKRITIFNENSAPSILFDDDNSSLEEYCSNLEKIFLSNKVSTLHCTSGSIILRPSKTTKMTVEEFSPDPTPDIKIAPEIIKNTKPLKTEKKPTQEQEDMIIED